MVDYSNISSRAMLASLHISTWNAQRFDRGASDEVTADKGAAAHTARVNKHLFGTRRHARATSPLFSAVLDAADALRILHNEQTLPWGKQAGERLLPSANWMAYTEKLRTAGRAFGEAADAFVAAYPRMRADAEQALGQLYRAEDFLSDSEVRGRFHYEIDFSPLPTGRGDFRLDLPDGAVALIEHEVRERLEATTRSAMRDAWERLHEAVSRIRKAAGKDGIVRGTLIENAQNVCDVLKHLNVAQDEQLEAMRRRVETELAVVAVEDLRTDEKLRAYTARRAAAIMDSMAAFYAPRADAA